MIHSNLLNIIRCLKSPQVGMLSGRNSSLDNRKGVLEFSEKCFRLNINYNEVGNGTKTPYLRENFKKIEFYSNKECYIFKDFFLYGRTHNEFMGEVRFLHTKGFSEKKNYYFRIIIPLVRKIDLHFCLEENKALVEGDLISFQTIHDENRNPFLIIESESKQHFDLFSKKVYAIKIALGYITGHLPGDEGYFFAYSNKEKSVVRHTYRSEFRNTIISQYRPIYSNPYGYIQNDKLADKYYNENILRKLNQTEFSILSQRVFDSEEFASVIVLILESSAASLLFMPGGYAIALETLTNLIKPKKNMKVSPMSPSLSRKIRKECGSIIEKYKDEFSNQNYLLILDRINQLNQSTNKAKLRRPFDYLKIELLDLDLKILNSRNDLLHGRVPNISDSITNRTVNQQNKELLYSSYRFYTLLSMLILKWIGFDNYVLNYPKLHESYTGIKLKEDLYRKL